MYEKAIIYSKPNCPYCIQAEGLLSDNNIEYTKLVLDEHYTREDLLEKVPNARSVPQIFLYNNSEEVYVGGYDKLSKLLKDG